MKDFLNDFKAFAFKGNMMENHQRGSVYSQAIL